MDPDFDNNQSEQLPRVQSTSVSHEEDGGGSKRPSIQLVQIPQEAMIVSNITLKQNGIDSDIQAEILTTVDALCYKFACTISPWFMGPLYLNGKPKIYYCFLHLSGIACPLSNVIYNQLWTDNIIRFAANIILCAMAIYMPIHITYIYNKNLDGVGGNKNNGNRKDKSGRETIQSQHGGRRISKISGSDRLVSIKHKLFKHNLWQSKHNNSKTKGFIYSIILLFLLFVVFLIILGLYWIVATLIFSIIGSSDGNKFNWSMMIFGITTLAIGLTLLMPLVCYGVFCGLFAFWYQELTCKEAFETLHKLECMLYDNNCNNSNKDEKNNNSMSTIVYEWYDKEYKPKWILIRKEHSMRLYNYPVSLMLIGSLALIWTNTSDLLDYSLGKVETNDSFVTLYVWGLFIIAVSVVGVLVFVFCLCQSSKYNKKILKTIKRMTISDYARQNNHFWKETNIVKQSIEYHSLKGQIFSFELSWTRVFRLTIVFTISKIVIYALSVDLQHW